MKNCMTCEKLLMVLKSGDHWLIWRVYPITLHFTFFFPSQVVQSFFVSICYPMFFFCINVGEAEGKSMIR